MKRLMFSWLLAGLLVATHIQPAFSMPLRPSGLAAPSLVDQVSGRRWGHGHRHGRRHHGGVWVGLGAGLLLGMLLAPPPYYRSAAPPRHYRYGYAAPPRRRSCHPVVKDVTDRHGRPVQLGATMCYHYNGAAYIVRGSRHVVGYY